MTKWRVFFAICKTGITDAGRQTQMRKKLFLFLSGLIVLAASSLMAAAQNAPAPAAGATPAAAGGQRPAGAPPPPMRLVSADISDGKQLAAKFTCTAGADA